MVAKNRSLLSPIGLVWRSVVVGLIYVVTSMITASLGSSMGVASDIPTSVDPTIIMLSMFVGGTLTSLVMGPVSTKLTLPRAQRIGVLFLVLYMFAYLIGAPEVALFTTYSLQFQAFILIMQFIMNLILAVFIGILFPSPQIRTGLMKEVKGYFAKRKEGEWLWRFVLASVLFFPIYFFFGFVFSPITGPYYNNPELGLSLVIPSFEIMLPVEFARGLIYALTVVPLLAVIRMPKWRLGLWMGLILAVVGAAVPQLVNVAWPLPLRLGHGVEMVLDSFAQGLMMAWLLWVEK